MGVPLTPPHVRPVSQARRERAHAPELPAMERHKPYRPPFWESKKFGEPYGDFNRVAKPKPVVVVAKPVAGMPTTDLKGRPVLRDNATLRASGKLSTGKAGGAAVAPVAALAKKTGRLSIKEEEAVDAAYRHNLAVGNRLQELEEQMRAALKARRQLHCAERELLTNAFRRTDPDKTRVVDVERFVQVWKSFGVEVTDREARAAFNKYGQTRDGSLPYPVFTEALLVGKARLVGMSSEVRRGAFPLNRPAEEYQFHGKILYPQCRKGVFTPSGWDGAAARRSCKPPDADMELTWVHGYARDCLANNLFYAADGTIVYFTAALGVVYDKEAHSQRFFTGHDDDVKCLTMSTGRNLCASGQVGKYPYVCVWDPATCEEKKRLKHPAVRGVAAVGFCRDAKLLASVGMDNNHTIFVWDWRAGKCMHEVKGHTDVPPKVYGIAFDPFGPDATAFMSYGVNHIKWWSKPTGAKTYSEESGKFAPAAKKHAVMSAVWLPSGRCLTGTPDGAIAVWDSAERKCVRVVRAHAAGPSVTREDGPPTHHGVRCLRLRADNKTLLSAGADGHVIAWDVSSGDLKEGSVVGATPVKRQSGNNSPHPPVFRGLDCMPGSDVFVAGTHRSEVWEVDETPRVLVHGHSADLYGIAWNPAVPTEYATASEGENVYVWCAASRKLQRTVNIGSKARCVGYSPDGGEIAVGCKNGGVHVLDAKSLIRVKWMKTLNEYVTDVKFSPDGTLLAAASADQRIDVYERKSGYKKIATCRGHSATVRHVDWCAQSKILRTVCGAYEILYFDGRTGRPVTANQRDTKWATWTSVLGFDVMGIWRDGSDGTDVNACDVSKSRRHVACADDFGGVSLLNYPCVVEDAPCAVGRGHSSHVMNVRFSPDDDWVVSVGGKDRAVFQWRFREKTREAPKTSPAPWEAAEVEPRGKARGAAAPGGTGAPWETPPALKK